MDHFKPKEEGTAMSFPLGSFLKEVHGIPPDHKKPLLNVLRPLVEGKPQEVKDAAKALPVQLISADPDILSVLDDVISLADSNPSFKKVLSIADGYLGNKGPLALNDAFLKFLFR